MISNWIIKSLISLGLPEQDALDILKISQKEESMSMVDWDKSAEGKPYEETLLSAIKEIALIFIDTKYSVSPYFRKNFFPS